MYATCLFCNGSLGRNEVLEVFPVGRRIAFDPAKGRLWVVCRKCERWNLSPLEERWEAFEECERRFRATRVRMSTDHIGLARLPEGLELVRIGEPLRPEFAAWRYGDQFGRRRRRTILLTGAGIAAMAGLTIGATITGVGAGGLWSVWNLAVNLPVRARLRTPDGRILKIRRQHLSSVKLYRDPDGRWAATLKLKQQEWFRGEDAEHAAAVLLPAMNRMAGTRHAVQAAVAAIEDAGHPEAYLARVGAALPRSDILIGMSKGHARVERLPVPTRLALEMALHEEQERRALAGELVELELAWREAEEVAAIADDLFVPPEHDAFIAKHRPAREAGTDQTH
jgi:hypothetical protein